MKQMDKNQNIISRKRSVLGITRKEFSDALDLNKQQEKQMKLWEENTAEIPIEIYQKVINFNTKPPYAIDKNKKYSFTMIDLFAGIGGIRIGFQQNGGKTVFSSEWDKFAQKTYKNNFGEIPYGDITKIPAISIPNHDILLAGFPCQPFSQAGLKKGFEDARGTLFFNIAEILQTKRPKAFLLENVKQLKGHNRGQTLKIIHRILDELNYYVPIPEVLNAKDFGIPQNRERIFIIGFNKDYLPNNFDEFVYPKSGDGFKSLSEILFDEVNEKYTISDKLYQGHLRRKKEHKEKGNGFGFSLFNKASKYINTISARYYKDGSEVLIEQENKNPRMLTPRECARLQGFSNDFIISVSNVQAYKQFGNSVCINVIDSLAKAMIKYMKKYKLI
ncbi:DNA (cytosine-5-)-methyltransferase [Mycoplasma sp. 4013]